MTTPDICTQCGDPLCGTGLEIGSQILCLSCGKVWTIPTYPLSVSLAEIVRRRTLERGKMQEAA